MRARDTIIIDATATALAVARKVSFFGVVEMLFGPASYFFVDLWVIAWTLGALISYALTFVVSNVWLSLILGCVALLRVTEYFVYQLDIILFAQYRSRARFWLRSYRRTLILFGLNYIETIFWFASCYSVLAQQGMIQAPLPWGMSLLRESIMLMVANSTGLVTPVSTAAWTIMTGHAAIGLMMTVGMLSRLIALLPRPGSADETDDDVAPTRLSVES